METAILGEEIVNSSHNLLPYGPNGRMESGVSKLVKLVRLIHLDLLPTGRH